MGRGVVAGIVLLLAAACSSAEPTLEESLRDGESAASADSTEEGPDADGSVDPDLLPVDAPDDEDATDTDPSDPASADAAGDAADDLGGDNDDDVAEADDDPFAVPDPIDGEYAELVINELLLVLSDSLRDYLADEDPGGAYAEQVHREVYGAPMVEAHLDTFSSVFGTEEGRATQFPPEEFGVQRFELIELVEAGEDCVTVFGFYDLTETSRFPYDDTAAAIVIKRDEAFRSEINYTSWRIWDGSLLLRDGEPIAVEDLNEITNLAETVDLECSSRSGATG